MKKTRLLFILGLTTILVLIFHNNALTENDPIDPWLSCENDPIDPWLSCENDPIDPWLSGENDPIDPWLS